MRKIEANIPYLGVAGLDDEDLMEAIIGRYPGVGQKIRLEGFELCEYTFADIPKDIQKILKVSWNKPGENPRFRFMRERLYPWGDVVMHHRINGKLWMVTPQEMDLINNFQIAPLWFNCAQTLVITDFVGTEPEDLIETWTRTHVMNIRGQGEKVLPSWESYHFPNGKKRMIDIANTVREEFSKSQK